MQHDLVGILRRVERIPFAPVVADSVREDRTLPVEVGAADGAAHFRVAFESVLGVLVPEVECAV